MASGSCCPSSSPWIGVSITYPVVGGESLHTFAEGVAHGGGHVPGKWAFIIMFGGLQLFLSMVSQSCDRLSHLAAWAVSCPQLSVMCRQQGAL